MLRGPRALAMLATLIMIGGSAAGCGPPPAAPAPSSLDAPTVAPSPSPVPKLVPDSSSAGDQQAALDAALREATAYLGLAPADLRISEVEAHEWGDASLGCPRPGIMYAQVVTPGYLVVVSGGGRDLEYHTDSRGRAVLCRER